VRGPAASDLLVRLMGREGWEDPYAIHRDARRQGPVAWSELGVAMVTGHAECSAVLKGAGWLADPRRNPVMPAELAEQDVSLLSLDPPDHTRLRKLVSSSFSARAIDRLSQVAQSYAQQLVKAAVQEGDVDVMSALAYPLPLAVICHLLGVPDEDRSRIGRWGYDLSPGLDLALSGPPPDSVVAASACVDDYFRGLIARKRKQPSGDFVGQLLEAQRNGAEIGDRELLNLCTLILLAGFVTTVNLIGNGLSSLLAHPDQWQECLSDPGLLGNAVEEMLRFESPVQYTARFPIADTTLARENFSAGRHALLLLGAANRDPAVFTDPDQFDITRPNANEHLAFATGIHHCLGAALARLEARALLTALLEQAPRTRLAETPVLRPVRNLRGFERLPVRLHAGS